MKNSKNISHRAFLKKTAGAAGGMALCFPYLILPVSIVFILLLTANISGEEAGCSQTEKICLTGDDFGTWRGDTGEWEIVGDVFTNPKNEKLLSSKPGTGVIVNGPTGKTKHLFSKAEFGDIKAHIEFMVPKGSNSGIYFMGRYEVQVFDSWGVKIPKHSDCGGIYQRWDEKRRPNGYEGRAPQSNASLPPGQWQSFDVIFRTPRFDSNGRKISKARFEKVVHNGKLIHADAELTGPTRSSEYPEEGTAGPLMFQGDHGPVAYRNIRIEPAGANPFFAMDTGTKDSKYKSARKQVQMLKELGYDGIGYTGCKGLDKMLEELDENGLVLYTVYLEVNIDEGQEKYDPKLQETIESLKGRNTILWLGVKSKKYKPSSPEGDERAVAIIREIADMADKGTLRVGLYPHSDFWIERVEDAVRVAKKVDRNNTGVTFNLCHWLKVEGEKNPRPVLESAMPYLLAVTINGADSNAQDWDKLIQTLDKGTFDVGQFLQTLNDAGYTGPIGLQGSGIEGDVYDNLKRSINAYRQLCKAKTP